MAKRLNNGGIELRYITDVTTIKKNRKTQEDEIKIVKKNVEGKITIHICDIKAVDYHFNNKGVAELDKCRIYCEPIGWLNINEPYEEMQSIPFDNYEKPIGFKKD